MTAAKQTREEKALERLKRAAIKRRETLRRCSSDKAIGADLADERAVHTLLTAADAYARAVAAKERP